ncbi:MAG TPA: hypothetical protein EYO33_32310 [Phycisphaerales bacterium]|nr:hypothetical protein [Phycisphaerales bacterium]
MSFLEFGLTASAADLVLDVYSGLDLLAEGFAPSTQNRVPIYPDDFTLNDVALAGEQIKIRARNTNAATARTLFFSLKITPA